ncbi:hypothetical protein N658DRAFT_178501 [Parathielavia hyrcaniae]|uniref:Secreted protein n=1 Tax=Parathielavia hyrcaniae TaxID=113614 RepID=A0AAN6Q6F9_9PEZI|nr:hypothetical protein N658DRAFT_178501 [Parathielavia hyrcaniae]
MASQSLTTLFGLTFVESVLPASFAHHGFMVMEAGLWTECPLNNICAALGSKQSCRSEPSDAFRGGHVCPKHTYTLQLSLPCLGRRQPASNPRRNDDSLVKVPSFHSFLCDSCCRALTHGTWSMNSRLGQGNSLAK